MNISTKGQYGLEALLDLAVHGDGGHINIKSIAERQNLSEKYLEQIFSVLKRNGIVTSIRGAQGGYALAKRPEDITVREVLNALEGPLSPVACVVEGQHTSCDRYDFCVTRTFWSKIMQELNRVTGEISLLDLSEFYNAENKTPLEYAI